MLKNISITLINIILFLSSILIYIFPDDYTFFNIIDYEDILSIIILLIFFFMSYLTKRLSKHKSQFGLWFILLIFLCVTSSFQSYYLYNQSFISGFLSQKEIIVCSLMYFPISKLMYNKVISKEDIIKSINIFAIIQLIIFFSQYLLSNNITFLNVHTAQRYGTIRYYFNPIILDLYLVYSLNNFINNQRRLESIISIIAVLLEVTIVQKYRLTFVGLVLTIIIGLLISKTSVFKKVHYLLTASLFSLFAINTRLVQNLISEFTLKTKTYTYSIRELGRKHYISVIQKYPVLGGGIPKSKTALIASGNTKGIFLSDNGVFGFAYIYGIIGILWLITFWLKLLKCGYRILIVNKNLFYLLFPLFFIITSINELHWYWQHGFIVLILFIEMLEYEYNKIIKKEEK